MGDRFLLGTREAFSVGFLADEIGDVLLRCKKRDKLTVSDRKVLESAIAILENIYKGYLLVLPRDKAREIAQQIPSYNAEYTTAFNYSVRAWSTLGLPLTSEAIRQRVELYQSTLKKLRDDVKLERSSEDVNEEILLEVQRFFSEIGELTLREVEWQAAWSPFPRSIKIGRLLSNEQLRPFR
jgi:hypothetical protein